MTEVAIGIGATILAAGLGYAGYSLYKKRKTDSILSQGTPVNVNIALPVDASANANVSANADANVSANADANADANANANADANASANVSPDANANANANASAEVVNEKGNVTLGGASRKSRSRRRRIAKK